MMSCVVFLMKLRQPRSNRTTHSFPTRRTSDPGAPRSTSWLRRQWAVRAAGRDRTRETGKIAPAVPRTGSGYNDAPRSSRPPPDMIVLEGQPALSPFRRERLESRLRALSPDVRVARAWHVYWEIGRASGRERVVPDV